MSNIKPHNGLSKSQFKKLLKKSEKVSSFAGPSYIAMHNEVINEIEVQRYNNAKTLQKNLHIPIGKK